MYITTDEWIEKFKPLENHLEPDSSFDGCQFETYGPELDYVKSKIDDNIVWTIVDDDNGNICVINGYHRSNRIGYLITEVAYDPAEEYNVYDEGDLKQLKEDGII